MKKLNGILWGLALVAVGIVFGLNALDVTHIEVFFDGWWTLFIIVPCAIEIISGKDRMGGFIGLLIGVVLLLAAQDVIEFSLVWKLAVPAIIVLVGVRIIWSSLFSSKAAKAAKKLAEKAGDKAQHCATFSGVDVNYDGMNFTAADLTAVFGGVKCDLRKAVIGEDVYINVCSVFGGVDILIPDDVDVKTSVNCIFGGVSNKKPKSDTAAVHTIYITGNCLFGGVDIK